ncbi:MAG: T9SS type A sorting domain-containing protein [Candidatus Krumholzibacteria bacterium]|nr:T9SS type A sorting domain-containing protein [Candidatus Krumholzibacteria bacterium]
MRRSAGINIVLSVATLVVAAILATTTAGAVRQNVSNAGKTVFSLRNDRVSINLPENGMLGECQYEGTTLGVRWPGDEGAEFLGSGGFFLSFRLKDTEDILRAGPEDFSLVEKGSSGLKLFEGCDAGKRYPAGGCDDDDDGVIDEDPLDGIDNDGDGLVDEDFAAIGHVMAVTKAAMPETGLCLLQNSFVWSFGHVRDFVGFTSRIGYFPEGDGPWPDLLDVSIAQQVDFDIGGETDRGRGNDDHFFLVRQTSVSGDDPDEPVPGIFGVAGGGDIESSRVAVIIFSACIEQSRKTEIGAVTEAECTPLSIESARIVLPLDDPLEFWAEHGGDDERGENPARQGTGESTDREAGAGIQKRKDSNGEFFPFGCGLERGPAIRGDYSIVNSLGKIAIIKPGETIRVEWAMIFGRTGEHLAANVARATQTYLGVSNDTSGRCHWIVPARKAARVEVGAKLVPVWIQGKRLPAVSVELPGDSDEEVEWLKIAGNRIEEYEQMYGRVMVTIREDLPQSGTPLMIEGQMTCGTLFRSMIKAGEIESFTGDESTAPDKLPDESLKIFPNPFVTDLNINLSVQKEPTILYSSQGESLRGIGSVKIYDVKGRLVRTVLEEEFLNPGDYSMGWDGKDENGTTVQPGVYYCKLQIGDKSVTKRVVLLR